MPEAAAGGAASQNSDVLLEVNNLKMHFPVGSGFLSRKPMGYIKAVDGVSFTVKRGETLGLVGESGCGKTTAGRCVLRAYQPIGGQLLYRQDNGEVVDLAPLTNTELKPFRQQLRMIFQDPFNSLTPRMTVLDIVGDPLKINYNASGEELEDRVVGLLRQVGLRPEYMRRYPHAFSGGERQRLGIARSLALDPRLVVADEAVSALDVSVRAQILNLMRQLQSDFDLTYLFVSHDLSVIEFLCDRVVVMYVGKIVEIAETEELFSSPLHPYTEALLSAVPNPNPRMRGQKKRIVLEGDVADSANPPSGCYFHPRCGFAKDWCSQEAPTLCQISPGHFAACHFAEELTLQGVKADGEMG